MSRPTRRGVIAGGLGVLALPRVGRAVPADAPPPAAPASALPDWPGQVVVPIGVYRCRNLPKGIAVTADSTEAWVTFLGGPPSVGVYRIPTGEELGLVDLGKAGGVEVVISRDQTRVWVSQMESHTVYELDRATRAVLRSFDTKSNWSKVIEPSADGTKLYVSNWNFDDVSEIDLATGTCVRRLPTVHTPRGLYASRDGRFLYVCGFGDGRFERIELATGSRATLFRGSGLRHVVADSEEKLAYITDMASRRVWRFEFATGTVVDWAKTDANPNTCCLSPDGRVLYVCNRGPNGSEGYLANGPGWGSILLYDTADGAVLDSIIGGNQCTPVAIAPNGETLLFADFRDDRLRMYRIPPYEALKAANWPRRDVHAKDLWKK